LQRHYEEAIAQIAQIRKSLPDFAVAHWGLWVAFHAKEMYEEALVEAKASLTFFAPGVPEAAEALERGHGQGEYAGAMHRAAEMLAEHSNRIYVKPYLIAELYACAGERDGALDWLERAYEDRTIEMVFHSNWPVWDSVRDDPRFQSLLRRMNLPF
jgi:tetratricopeptide (TPR) repeat protein